MLLCYAFVVLSDLVCLPSAPGWDSTTAKKEAGMADLGKEIKDKVESLTKTGGHTGERDVWSFFCSGLGGMLAWHKKRETQHVPNGDTSPDNAKSTSGASTRTNRCNVRDVLDSCSLLVALHYRVANMSASCDDRGSIEAADKTMAGEHNETEEQESLPSLWDETIWQSMFDDFSLFSPTQPGGVQAGAFAPL
jgi:hypothetical protein